MLGNVLKGYSEGLRKYVDEKIEDIINEMHHAMMINHQEKQAEPNERDRAMSECTILRRPNQPLQDFESDVRGSLIVGNNV